MGAAAGTTGSAARLDERRRLLQERLAGVPEWLRSTACLGGLAQAIKEGTLPAAFDPDPAMCPVLSGLEPLEPIQTVDELIDAVGRLFEIVDGSDAIERVVDGLMRVGGETTDDFEAKTAGIRQTKFSDQWSDWTTPTMLRTSLPGLLTLLGHWLGGSFMGSRPTRSPLPALGPVDQRIAMLATRFRSRRFGPVLGTPTHRGGWIDPRVFVERMKSLDLGLWLVHKFDLIAGLLRLAPDFVPRPSNTPPTCRIRTGRSFGTRWEDRNARVKRRPTGPTSGLQPAAHGSRAARSRSCGTFGLDQERAGRDRAGHVSVPAANRLRGLLLSGSRRVEMRLHLSG